MRGWLFLTCLLWAVAGPARAHDLGLAQVDLDLSAPAHVVLRAKLSATVGAETPQVPAGCTVVTGRARPAAGGNQLATWTLGCDGGTLPESVILPWPLQAATVSYLGADGRVQHGFEVAADNRIRIAIDPDLGRTPTVAAQMGRYTVLGIEHILIGLDHIALLVCLAFLASGWTLVRLATAFTVGHSITLCLAALDMIRLPVPPMEAVIALSVVYLARDAVLGRRLGRAHTGLLAMIGLIHGLGFASVLSDIGLPVTARLPALLSFNIGVELGQLLVLALLTLTGAGLRLAYGRIGALWQPGAASVIGVLAAYWTIERIAGFI